MIFVIIHILSFILIVFANVQNSLIIDYFEFKKVPVIVGYSCNTIEGKNCCDFDHLYYKKKKQSFHRRPFSYSILQWNWQNCIDSGIR